MAWDFTGGFSSSGAGQNNSTAAGWDFSGGFKFDPEKEKKKKDLEQSVQQLADDLFVDASPPDTTSVQTQNSLLDALNSMSAESSTPFISPRMDVVNANLDDYQKSIGDSDHSAYTPVPSAPPVAQDTLRSIIEGHADQIRAESRPAPAKKSTIDKMGEAFHENPLLRALSIASTSNTLSRAEQGLLEKAGYGKSPLIVDPETGFERGLSKGAGFATDMYLGGKALKAIAPVVGGGAKKAADFISGLPTGVQAAGGAAAVLGGAETVRGAFTPNEKAGDRSFLGQTGASLRTGTGQLLETVGGIAKWRDWDELGESLGAAGQKIKAGYEGEPVDFSWRAFFDPDFYSVNVAQSLPMTLSLIPAMYGGYKLGGSAGAKMGLNPFRKAILSSLTGAGVSRPLESAMEAGSVYEEAISRGMDPEKAEQAANSAFKKNLSLVGLDAAQLAGAFAPIKGLQATTKLGKIGIGAGRLAGGGVLEAGEEGLQEVFQRQALGDPVVYDPQMGEAMAIGGLFGVGMGGAGVINDTYQAIKERTIENMPEGMRTQVRHHIETEVANGATEEEAFDKALDAIAETEEGQQVINEAVQGINADVNSGRVVIMPYATREERYGTLTDKRGLVTGGEGVSGLPAGTTPATPVYHKGNPVQVVSIPNNEYYIVQDAAGKKMAVAQDEVEVRAEVTQPVVQDTVIPTESTPADKTPAVTDDTEQTAAVTAGVASVPQMGDKPVEDETSQGQATQKEPWQMTKPELAQQKPGENPAAKQELAGEGAKTTGAQPPVPAVAGNKVKQQAVIVRHPDGDGYAVSAGVDRWISGGGGAFGGGSIGKWNTVEGAIKGTSHLNKKDWDIVVSDELKPGAQQDSSRDTADSIRKAYDAVTKMYMDKYGLSEAPEQPILAAEVADEWGKRQGMKPTQARKSFREAVAKLMEEGTAGDIVIGSVRDVNNSLGRITVGGRDIQLGTVYVRPGEQAQPGKIGQEKPPEAEVSDVKGESSGTLADYNLTITKTTTKNGNTAWKVGGDTMPHKDVFKRAGARWYKPHPKAKGVWTFYGDEDPTAKILAKLPKLEKKEEAAEQKSEANPPKYGRAGNAAYKKWGANEYVNANLDDVNSQYTKAFRAFFEAYYNAGLEGNKPRFDDPIKQELLKSGHGFPPFLEDVFYKAGVKDAAEQQKREEKKAPEAKPELTYSEQLKQDNDKIIKEKDYGRSGKTAIRKEVSASSIDLDTNDGIDLLYFFEKYYNAGRNGKWMPSADMHQDKAREFYEAGKKDRERAENSLQTGGRGGKIPGPEVKPEPKATKQPANKQKESLQTGQDSGLERDYPSREKPETKTEPPKSTKVDTSQKAETAVESKQGKAKDIEGWLEKAEQAAWSRLESRKGRLMAGLPMDDLVDYAIIGAAKLARKALNLAEFTASMLEDIKAHFGEEAARKTKPFMPGVYGQAQAMLEMTPDEIEEMISTASKEEGDQDESADSSILDEGTEGSSGGAGGQLSPGTDDDSAGSPGGKSSKAPGRNDTKDTGDVPIQPGPSGGKREESDLQETDTGVAGDKRPRREADGADGSKGGQRRGDGEDAEGSNAGSGVAYKNYRINEENPVFTGGGKKT